MKANDFLVGGDGKEDPIKRYFIEDAKLIRKCTKEVAQLWQELYHKHIGEMYLITPKEKKHLSKLVEEYGLEKTVTTITYYINNFRRLKKPEGWPTISALYGFRRGLVLDATKGEFKPTKEFKGQYDPNKLSESDPWG